MGFASAAKGVQKDFPVAAGDCTTLCSRTIRSFDSVDAVLLLKTYHEIAHPIALLRNLRSLLKPGTKIDIIDCNGNANHSIAVDVLVPKLANLDTECAGPLDFVSGDVVDYFLMFNAIA